ncbi:MAG: DUF1810 domain-containing protein [Nakamurella sp.]
MSAHLPDADDLERFVAAQDAGATYQQALDELGRGRKTSHWMWFVFPQIAGLGQSSISVRYAIASLQQARAYLAHPVLGPRLLECARAIAEQTGRTAEQVMGGIDALKLNSSMTLFHRADPAEPLFQRVIDMFFDGVPDAATDQRLWPTIGGDRGSEPA